MGDLGWAAIRTSISSAIPWKGTSHLELRNGVRLTGDWSADGDLTSFFSSFAEVLQEALETTCAKCSPEQEVKIKDTLAYLCKKKRRDFDEILARVDPDQKYRTAFEAKFGKLEGCAST
ncbi:uncharacterized protein LOC107221749 isoform X2 [Neodiprion lecontei]|uniref:Uncharacterized protein LOC107221749 isoform X2 n=1 Tax=Neodiprion lecontei TaxID=441921 RepID=A0ABM3G1T6_NEOLC|nr:uncharacterized protein LOC107221749 isoform X2 [Neodiprion lecontei]